MSIEETKETIRKIIDEADDANRDELAQKYRKVLGDIEADIPTLAQVFHDMVEDMGERKATREIIKYLL